MMSASKKISFDTDYGVVGMSVDPMASETDFDFTKETIKNDGYCGSTFDFVSKSFVNALVKTKVEELSERLKSIEDRLRELETVLETAQITHKNCEEMIY